MTDARTAHPAPAGAVDLPDMAVRFGRALHRAGIAVTPERSARFARSLGLLEPLTRTRLRDAGRAVFVSTQAERATFDRVFGQVFEGLTDPAEARGDPGAPELTTAGRRPAATSRGQIQPPAAAGGGSLDARWAAAAGSASTADEDGPDTIMAAASAAERLGGKSFAELDPDELAQVRRMIARLRVATPERRSRRSRRARHGPHIDVRRTLRASLRTCGDPVRHVRRRRRTRPRQLVLICDVSGSMEPYARAFLTFLESGVGGASAEAFVFASQLTRVSRTLADGRPETAIQRAADAAPDLAGGTRLAAALKTFNDRYGRRGMARGAVVVVLSDGWESGDPAAVGREMERLGRLAWRIVWVNPRAASPAFAPLAGGMAAALPHCDAFVSGHSVDALDAVVDAIAADD